MLKRVRTRYSKIFLPEEKSDASTNTESSTKFSVSKMSFELKCVKQELEIK